MKKAIQVDLKEAKKEEGGVIMILGTKFRREKMALTWISISRKIPNLLILLFIGLFPTIFPSPPPPSGLAFSAFYTHRPMCREPFHPEFVSS